MSANFSEAKAKAELQEAEERLNEGRRGFFKVMGAGAAAASGIGGVGGALYSNPALAYGGPFASAFSLHPPRIYMNIGTTGSTPTAVLKNYAANNALVARDPTISFSTQEMRDIIAPGLGAHPFEVVLSYNTTDGMSLIFNGIEASAGDEIISTNMEHGGGNSPMQIKADRTGMVIRRMNLPTNDAYSDAEVLARFQALRNDNTKFIMFSSPPYLTGIRLPEKLLCEWAASQGIVSIIDGAHGTGMLNLNFHDMAVDFYAGSGHKWQCGPGGTGILYIRNLSGTGHANTTELPNFWPTFGGYSSAAGATLNLGIRDPNDNVAGTMMSRGHPNYPALRALTECCQMWDAWGRQNIEDYIVALAQYLRSRLAGIWGQRSMATQFDPVVRNHNRVALTSFNPFSPGFDYNADLSPEESAAQATVSSAAVAALRAENVVVRNNSTPHSLRSDPTQNANAVAANGPVTRSSPLRISTHLFHNMRDVDNLIDKLLLTVPHP
jgi:selenocysteine lyase/cysteine desulfurase